MKPFILWLLLISYPFWPLSCDGGRSFVMVDHGGPVNGAALGHLMGHPMDPASRAVFIGYALSLLLIIGHRSRWVYGVWGGIHLGVFTWAMVVIQFGGAWEGVAWRLVLTLGGVFYAVFGVCALMWSLGWLDGPNSSTNGSFGRVLGPF